MAHFSNWAVTATIMLLMAAQSCHCEKNVHEKGKKIQTPGLWSALGCMITDDDITKCVRDHTVDTTDRKDKADVSDEELSANSDDDDDSPGFFDAISTFMTDGIFRFFEDDDKDKKQETDSHNDVEDHSDDDYDSNDNDDEEDDDDTDDDDDEDDDNDDESDDDDDDESDDDDSDEDLDDADNFVNTSNRTTSTAVKRKNKRSVAGVHSIGEESQKRRRKEDKMMKLMMLGMMLKSKLSAIMTVFGAFMQLKFFALSMLNLLVGLVRLYLDLTKKKDPQKVIYYEQAHHQHVYDQHEDKDWLGGWLSKKDDTVSHTINGNPHSMVYSGQKPST